MLLAFCFLLPMHQETCAGEIPSFADPIILQAGQYPHVLVVADFNNDSRNDIAAINLGSNDLYIYLNMGGVSYTHTATYSCPSGPYDIDTADFNHDGAMDIVTVSAASSQIYVFINNGMGEFTITAITTPHGYPITIGTAFINNDSNPDILVTYSELGLFDIFYTDSFGNIVKDTTVNSGPRTYDTKCMDIDNDGDNDIAVSVAGESKVKIYLNDGYGNLQFGFDATVGSKPYPLASGDLNGDSYADLVVANYDPGDFRLLINESGNSFSQVIGPFGLPDEAAKVNVADLNNDGDNDIVVSHGNSSCVGGVEIYSNDGQGNITPTNTLGSWRNHCVVADIDGTGGPDIVMNTTMGNTIEIYINTTHFVVVNQVTVRNEVIDHLLGHDPIIAWTYYDNQSNPQDSIQLGIGIDRDWSLAEMWDLGPVASPDTSVTYAGMPLIDGATYYLRLRVHNGYFWSLWYDTTFRMNSVPSIPALARPDSDAVLNTATPTLFVHNSSDAENDTINYEFAVVNDSAFGQLNEFGVSGFPEETDSTGWRVFQSLNENWKYWWRSRAYDQYENSPWSSIKSFWVNAVEEPPALFNINPLPETTGTVFQMLPQFHWLSSSDPDPYDSIHYTLYIALDSNFLYLRTIENIQSNYYQLADSLLFGIKYWWKVKATDKTGRYTYSSNTLSFRTWKLGDANGDWLVNIQDITFIINFLYKTHVPPSPLYVGDINGNCRINIQDISYLISYLHKNGPAPKIGCMP